MNLMEKLETRFDPQIVFPDELAREAANEIKQLREALIEIDRIAAFHQQDGVSSDCRQHALIKIIILSDEAIEKLTVPQQTDVSKGQDDV